MAYTTINKSSDNFNTVIYSGSSSNQTISGVGFQSDMTWFKNRNNTANNALQNSVVGAGKRLSSDRNVAEGDEPNGLGAWNSDGFTFQGDYSGTAYNASGRTYVAWNWKAGTSFTNDASATGIGSIDSAGSANQDAGFSICTYTNTNTNTIKHGLNVVPDVIIAKTRGVSGSWFLGSEKMLGGWNKKLNLDTTGAVATETRPFYPGSVAPTSTVFSSDQSVFGAGGSATETMVAYCFAEKQGYSKFGSYTGNGNADGTFVYTGFKPAFVMVKKTNAANNWVIIDNKRDPFNLATQYLLANDSSAEGTGLNFDLYSNGFKLRSNSGGTNTSGSTYIYMAFAKAPLVGTNNVPCTAR